MRRSSLNNMLSSSGSNKTPTPKKQSSLSTIATETESDAAAFTCMKQVSMRRHLSSKLNVFHDVVRPFVTTHRRGFFSHAHTFSGTEAVCALVGAGWAKSRQEAVCQVRLLQDAFHVFEPVGRRGRDFQDKTTALYRFVEHSTTKDCDETALSSSLASTMTSSFTSNSGTNCDLSSVDLSQSLYSWDEEERAAAKKAVRDEIKRQEKQERGLDKLIQHNRKLADTRLQSGHDVGSVMCWKLVLKYEADKSKIKGILARLDTLLVECCERTTPIPDIAAKLETAKAAPRPKYIMQYDDLEELLEQGRDILGLGESDSESYCETEDDDSTLADYQTDDEDAADLLLFDDEDDDDDSDDAASIERLRSEFKRELVSI